MEDRQGQIDRIDFQERRGRRCYGRQRYRAWKSGKSGERSPVKVSLALMAGILALALVIVLQG